MLKDKVQSSTPFGSALCNVLRYIDAEAEPVGSTLKVNGET
jgi:hypothetical protein